MTVLMGDLVEIPAIAVAGRTEVLTPELLKLSDKQLAAMADLMGGVVIYLKCHSYYQPVEDASMCTTQGCWRPANHTH